MLPLLINALHQWMADKMRVRHSSVSIDFFLEWKNDQHLLHYIAQQWHSRRMPRPYLRTDIIDDANAPLLRFARETNIEAGIIDKEQHVWFALVQQTCHLYEDSPEKPESTGDFDKT